MAANTATTESLPADMNYSATPHLNFYSHTHDIASKLLTLQFSVTYADILCDSGYAPKF